MPAQLLEVVGSRSTTVRASAWNVSGPAANFSAAVPPLLGCGALRGAAATAPVAAALAEALEATASAPPEDELASQVKVGCISASHACRRLADRLLHACSCSHLYMRFKTPAGVLMCGLIFVHRISAACIQVSVSTA